MYCLSRASRASRFRFCGEVHRVDLARQISRLCTLANLGLSAVIPRWTREMSIPHFMKTRKELLYKVSKRERETEEEEEEEKISLTIRLFVENEDKPNLQKFYLLVKISRTTSRTTKKRRGILSFSANPRQYSAIHGEKSFRGARCSLARPAIPLEIDTGAETAP